MNRRTSSVLIPSCLVTKDLLQLVQDKMKACAEVRFPDGGAEMKSEFTVEITDASGTDEFEDIKSYLPSKFDPTTSRVDLKLRRFFWSSPDAPSISIRLTFSSAMNASLVSVDCESDDPRQTVDGTVSALCSDIATAKSFHAILHKKWFEVLLIMLPIGIFLVAVLYGAMYPDVKVPAAYMLTTVLVLPAFLASQHLQRVFPYCVFDNARNDSERKFWVWIYTLIVSAIVVAPIVRSLIG